MWLAAIPRAIERLTSRSPRHLAVLVLQGFQGTALNWKRRKEVTLNTASRRPSQWQPVLRKALPFFQPKGHGGDPAPGASRPACPFGAATENQTGTLARHIVMNLKNA